MAGKCIRKDPEKAFEEIYKKYLKTNLPLVHLSKLSSVRLLTTKSKNKQTSNRFLFLQSLVSILIVLTAVRFYYFDEYLIAVFTKIWLRNTDISKQMCTISTPDKENFLPPFDCAVCQNITEVQRVINISPEEFSERFAYSTIPVIIADGMKDWSAAHAFGYDFFKSLYLNGSDVVGTECDFFSYQTEFRDLIEVFEMSEERSRKPWYIGWSNCDSKIGNILRQHYKKPYFLPLESESARSDWIFMGTSGLGAPMHIDFVFLPSWQAQIKGRKLWVLQPLPECYNTCKTLEVVVEPGEVIVVDTNVWYHRTSVQGNDLSITIGAEYD